MPAPLAGLIAAVLLDLSLGDPPNCVHPVVAMGTYIRLVSGAFNTGSTQRRGWAGATLLVSGIVLFSLPFVLLQIILPSFPYWVQVILTAIFLKATFSFRRLISAVRQVQSALKNADLDEARRLTAWHLVSRETGQLSRGHVASAAIESLTENLTDSFLSPLLFFAVGGLPLAWAYRFVNTADAMIGYRNEDFEYFGKAAARLDDILNWIPARTAGLLLVVSSLLSGMNPVNAWKILCEQHSKTTSPNAGWTMSAAAGALCVILEKPGNYRLEGGSNLPVEQDISRSIRLVSVAMVLSLLLCGGIFIAIHYVS